MHCNIYEHYLQFVLHLKHLPDMPIPLLHYFTHSFYYRNILVQHYVQLLDMTEHSLHSESHAEQKLPNTDFTNPLVQLFWQLLD